MDEKRKKALDAAAILNSPVFGEAVDGIQARAIETWKAAKTPQEREDAWHLQRAAEILRREIYNVLQCAAVNAGGKDTLLNAELEKVKESKNGRRKRSS